MLRTALVDRQVPQPVKRVINRSQLERALAGAMLPWSDWGVPLFERKGEDESEAASLHCPVSTAQTNAVQEYGTYGEQSKAVGCVSPTALLSAVAASGPGSPSCQWGMCATLAVVTRGSKTEPHQIREKALAQVRPRHEDDDSHAERQEQHQAEVEFCSLPSLLPSIHLRETSSALLNIELAHHGTLG